MQVNIIITGHRGEGKTRCAEALKKTLQEFALELSEGTKLDAICTSSNDDEAMSAVSLDTTEFAFVGEVKTETRFIVTER